MHSLRIVTVLTASLTLLGSALAQDKPAPAEASAKKLDEKVYDHFGDGITKGEKPVPLTEVMKDPTKYTGKKVRVVAPITGVCQTKGCWMTLG
ncbi:MAG: hypothetical protein KDB94_05215, partial [Acidobacteria bacterium]|nr:hypothetical protein [Acidobacteriota bacterium]